jgi:hypothetical protein
VRIWDVSPGYLNRQSLLGEHRELHGLHSILVHGKKGYSRHPETLRWAGCLSGLCRRHALLVAEMTLRGYAHLSPLDRRRQRPRWPDLFVDVPERQYAILRSKYREKEGGRIPLPRNAQDLWAHHKYSVLARDQELYRAMGRRVARMRRGSDLEALSRELVLVLREQPAPGPLANAVDHMWGYVSGAATAGERRAAARSVAARLLTTAEIAARTGQPYLMMSTAVTDLVAFTRSAA